MSYTGDGGSYLRYAQFILGRESGATAYDLRLFPGVPALIALWAKLGAILEYAGLVQSWVVGGIAAAGAAALYRDRRIGIATVILLPEFLISSARNMSEGPVLAMSVVGLLLATRNWPLLGGIALGIAVTFRPMACFAVLGFLALAVQRRDWRAAARVLAASAAVVVGALAAMEYFLGDALLGVKTYASDPRAYGGRLFMWPGQSLVMTPIWYPPVPVGKIAYVWAHVALIAAGCVLAWQSFVAKDRSWADVLSFPWLLGNSLFALTVGGRWGFQIYPRLQAPSEPALFRAYHRWLPRKAGWWVLIGAACFAQSVINMRRS